MKQTRFLVVEGDKIYPYQRKDLLVHDFIIYQPATARIFELHKGIMRDHYQEINKGDLM